MHDIPKVEHIQIVCVTHVVGSGVPADPFRSVKDYHLPDGTFLQRVDGWMFDENPYQRLAIEIGAQSMGKVEA